jgi:hypothetical protein
MLKRQPKLLNNNGTTPSSIGKALKNNEKMLGTNGKMTRNIMSHEKNTRQC